MNTALETNCYFKPVDINWSPGPIVVVAAPVRPHRQMSPAIVPAIRDLRADSHPSLSLAACVALLASDWSIVSYPGYVTSIVFGKRNVTPGTRHILHLLRRCENNGDIYANYCWQSLLRTFSGKTTTK